MDERGIDMPRLQAFELPFAYIEAGEKKQALVKVKVCDKCARKITYKPSEAKGSTESRQEDLDSSKRRSHRDTNGDSRTASPEGSRTRGERRHRRRSESPQRT
jgi:protein FRA10AC1